MLLDRQIMSVRPSAALDALVKDYADIGARSRVGLRITPSELKDSYTVSVIGVIRPKRLLVLTAPVTDDGALVAVHNGQILTCRWFGATTAFRFKARIIRILFEPIPQILVELPTIVDRRTVRGVPRALANLRAVVTAQKDFDSAIVDISTSGARIAVGKEAKLQRGDQIVLKAKPKMLHRQFELTCDCNVIAGFGVTDPRHPDVQFFGFEFGDMEDSTLLVLHAYVQECLAFETDALAQVLLLYSKEVDDIE